MRRIFVDTNVLFPFSVMDVMLALTEDGIHEVCWTERLLAEWERVVTRDRRRSTSTAKAITTAIRECFAESEVHESDYLRFVPAMPGRDPDDRHHMAAAVSGGAAAVVTWNLSDFPADALGPHGVRVVDPDTYLCELATEFSDEVSATVARLAGEKRRPPMTALDLVEALHRAGVRAFADLMHERLLTRADEAEGGD